MSADYFLEIESHFAHRRGTPFILNAKDWALMKSWSEEGIPLPIVIEAIDAVFDKSEAGGSRRKVNSLSYCRHAVKELWQERRGLQVGSDEASPEENVVPLLESLAAAVETVAAGYGPRIRELAKEKSAPRIEERLIELELQLLDELLAGAGAGLREQARALASGADDKSRARAEEAHLRRLTRERFGLPRLTLF